MPWRGDPLKTFLVARSFASIPAAVTVLIYSVMSWSALAQFPTEDGLELSPSMFPAEKLACVTSGIILLWCTIGLVAACCCGTDFCEFYFAVLNVLDPILAISMLVAIIWQRAYIPTAVGRTCADVLVWPYNVSKPTLFDVLAQNQNTTAADICSGFRAEWVAEVFTVMVLLLASLMVWTYLPGLFLLAAYVVGAFLAMLFLPFRLFLHISKIMYSKWHVTTNPSLGDGKKTPDGGIALDQLNLPDTRAGAANPENCVV